MKSIFQIILISLLWLTTICFSSVVSYAQAIDNKTINSIKEFLNNNEELTNYSSNGFSSKFTGEFYPLPDDLKNILAQDFPNLGFYVARMSVLIDFPAKKYNLILVVDKSTSKVLGFVWGDYWMLPNSKNFSSILSNQKLMPNNKILKQVKSIALLIVSSSSNGIGKVGKAYITKRNARIEMLRGEHVFAVFEVKYDKSFKILRTKLIILA